MANPLKTARLSAGWSQARLAHELRRLAQRTQIGVASADSLKTQISRWENGHVLPVFYQPLLCELFMASPAELGFTGQELPADSNGQNNIPVNLISKQRWTRDDISSLSALFDEAVSHCALSDIEMLAHEWLSANKPQLIELSAGRRIGDSLVTAIEHRVMQLRRADDFISGRDSHALVLQELKATSDLLNKAALTDSQSRRLLTATAELAQLAAWVAADAGLYRNAAKYTESGVLAAHAADNPALAANIISTLSYQLANTGNPRQAALLARTAYAGGHREATATTRALLLERVAWADAKSGDLSNCERMLGLVEDDFGRANPDEDPDWVYWLNRNEIDVMAGRCYTELKNPARAEPLLRNAISTYSDTLIRENVLYLSWLAEDYILLGDIDEAAGISTEILELKNRANSSRTDERLKYLVKLLRHYKDVQSVREFIEQYRVSS